MLRLTEARLAGAKEDGGESAAVGADGAELAIALEPDSPEAALVAYLDSLSTSELAAFRQEICLAAMREIDRHFAKLEAG